MPIRCYYYTQVYTLLIKNPHPTQTYAIFHLIYEATIRFFSIVGNCLPFMFAHVYV